MTGPRLRGEIEAMILLSYDEREKRMEKMSNNQLALLNEVIARANKKEFELEKIHQAILWKMPDGELAVEICGKG